MAVMKKTSKTIQPTPEAVAELAATDPAPGVGVDVAPVTTETPVEQPKAEEQPKPDEIVSITLADAFLQRYAIGVVNGQRRNLDLAKCRSFDEKTGVVTMTAAQARTWKLA